MLTSSAKVARMPVHINPIIKTSPGFFLHKIKENIQQIAVNIPKVILIIIVILFKFVMSCSQSALEFGYKFLFAAGIFPYGKINSPVAIIKTITDVITVY